jgi:osmotically-inducible protein OsmY
MASGVIFEAQWDPQIPSHNITVEVEGGTVKLYGGVGASAEKEAVERTARSAAGVTRVENFLTIIPRSAA